MAGLWDIDKIEYVGRTKGLQEGLGFQYYDADKVVAGKKMKDWLRFGVAWWHTFDAPASMTATSPRKAIRCARRTPTSTAWSTRSKRTCSPPA